MATIRLTAVSRQTVTDPVVTQFVDEVADLLKIELLQAFAAQRDGAAAAFRPGTVVAGVKRKVTYDSVPKVVIERWYKGLERTKQQAVLRAAPHTAQLDPRLLGTIRGGRIDLRSAKPVLEQVDLHRRFGAVDFLRLPDRLLGRLDDIVIPGDGGGGTIVANKGLRFRVNRVRCIDETDPEFLGKDTIAMGGTAVDDQERVTTINQFEVGEFNDGDQVNYGTPKVLQSFDLSGGSFPKVFAVFLAIAEKDAGGFGGFLRDLYEAVKAEVTVIITALGAAAGAAIGAAIGGSLGTAIGGPIGTVIGIAAGLILGALVGWLADLARDDLFEPQVAVIELPNATATFAGGALTSPTFTFTYADFGGQYRVSYSWELAR